MCNEFSGQTKDTIESLLNRLEEKIQIISLITTFLSEKDLIGEYGKWVQEKSKSSYFNPDDYMSN